MGAGTAAGLGVIGACLVGGFYVMFGLLYVMWLMLFYTGKGLFLAGRWVFLFTRAGGFQAFWRGLTGKTTTQ
jgi:hypothetical protein